MFYRHKAFLFCFFFCFFFFLDFILWKVPWYHSFLERGFHSDLFFNEYYTFKEELENKILPWDMKKWRFTVDGNCHSRTCGAYRAGSIWKRRRSSLVIVLPSVSPVRCITRPIYRPSLKIIPPSKLSIPLLYRTFLFAVYLSVLSTPIYHLSFYCPPFPRLSYCNISPTASSILLYRQWRV